jgi:hypothetical protein
MNTYEVRVKQTHIDYYRVEAKDADNAKQQVNEALSSRIMGNVSLDDTIKREHVIEYAVQLSPEGEVII